MGHRPRNEFLAPGITRFSRSVIYKRKALFKRQKKTIQKVETKPPTTRTVEVKGEKNGDKRVIPLEKAARFYPAEDIPHPKKSRKVNKLAKLRSTIIPGTILILLAGRFRGKRVVFLKQLQSGLLLVTGPFKINGVPLRRVNQSYVIATSTKLDISACSVDKIDDVYFKKDKKSQKKVTDEEILDEGQKEKQKKSPSKTRADDQKEIDGKVITKLKDSPHLREYLHARFSLSKGQFPHVLKF